jgi:hypothetical protein
MRSIFISISFCVITLSAIAQNTSKKEHFFKGMYIQWGYNTEWYTKSNIHFTMSNGNDFILHNVVAHDATDFDAIYKKPLDISIPQYNYRFGFYLNKEKTRALEINFDHAKYIVTDFQKVLVTGIIDGKQVNGDSILNPNTFLHFEHTDGANWLHFNYVQQQTLAHTAGSKRKLLTWLWKAGAGINIPRTDFTWKGDRLNNNFHVAGYNISAESGFRLYPSKKFFIETTGKTGYVRYVNALANTTTSTGNRAKHGFGYFELIATFGFDINF